MERFSYVLPIGEVYFKSRHELGAFKNWLENYQRQLEEARRERDEAVTEAAETIAQSREMSSIIDECRDDLRAAQARGRALWQALERMIGYAELWHPHVGDGCVFEEDIKAARAALNPDSVGGEK